jgi:hypothetical protein
VYKTHFNPRPQRRVDVYEVLPEELRARTEWVLQNIERESQRANEIAVIISWETLKPKYIKALEAI